MTKKPDDISALDYEQALTMLEQLTSQLETEQLPLEKMIAYYERGQALANHCNQLLDEAELRMKTLQPGKPVDLDAK